MASRVDAGTFALSFLSVSKDSGETLHGQLYRALRGAILNEALPPGQRLPSTRAIAEALEISRNTVNDVFAQLFAEGLTRTRRGSGTYVAPRAASNARRQTMSWQQTSSRGKLLAHPLLTARTFDKAGVAFETGLPAIDRFPYETWAGIASSVIRSQRLDLASYGNPAGYGPLREVIAAHLRMRKGIPCDVDQVIVTGGTQQARDLICRLTLDAGDGVWLEDPVSDTVRATFVTAGARVVSLPVDEHGIRVDVGKRLAPAARLAHVTSMHQWPTGSTLSTERGAELVRWAGQSGAWIVEDEYDGVFWYDGEKPPYIIQLDGDHRVIWIGSFSVKMFPALRIGYIVAPPQLVEGFIAAKAVADRQTSSLEQAMLAEFMLQGHYLKHLRAMRELYHERRTTLIAALNERFDLPVIAGRAGLHVTLRLPDSCDDRDFARRAAAAGLTVAPFSRYYSGEPRQGLILGFGTIERRIIERRVAELAEVVTPLLGRAGSGPVRTSEVALPRDRLHVTS